MKRYLLLLFIFWGFTISYSQSIMFKSPYKLSLGVDMPISFNAVAFLGSSFLVGKQNKAPDINFINSLNPNQVNVFDRSATRQWDKKAGLASDVLLYSSIALPALHAISPNSRRDFKHISVMWAEVFLLNMGVTNLIKEIGKRPRPYMYNPNVPFSTKNSKESLKSFFSGHVSTTASMSFFFAKTFHDYHPNSKLRPMVWTLCAVTPLATAFLRWKAGKHFWTDVLTGYAVGALIGVGVPWLHQSVRKFNR